VPPSDRSTLRPAVRTNASIERRDARFQKDDAVDEKALHRPPTTVTMTHVLNLWCGCTVRVSHEAGRPRETRVIDRRGDRCPERHHVEGARVWLWEILPDPRMERLAAK